MKYVRLMVVASLCGLYLCSDRAQFNPEEPTYEPVPIDGDSPKCDPIPEYRWQTFLDQKTGLWKGVP